MMGPRGSRRQVKEIKTIARQKPTLPERDSLVDLVTASLEDDKAQDVVVIDLSGKTDFADFMVIATGTSQRHVASMAEHLREKFKSAGQSRVPVEGLEQGDWVLVDGGDVVVHVFRADVRKFYELEKIWGVPASKHLAAAPAPV